MLHDNNAMNRLVRKHKAALTRAKKKGPKAVIEACDKAFADFDEHLPAWPDNWHLWNIAKQDAEYEVRRAEAKQFFDEHIVFGYVGDPE